MSDQQTKVDRASLAARITNNVRAELEGDSAFVDGIVERVLAKLLADERLIETIAERSGEAAIAGIASAFAAVPAKRAAPSRPAAAKKAPKAKRGGRKAGSSPMNAAHERVLLAIRGGASKKSEILLRAKVTDSGYSSAIMGLKKRGLVRIEGERAAAKILATK